LTTPYEEQAPGGPTPGAFLSVRMRYYSELARNK
jgi:hypothetical protein